MVYALGGLVKASLGTLFFCCRFGVLESMARLIYQPGLMIASLSSLRCVISSECGRSGIFSRGCNFM
jgi:hypothetical protein